jgi:hypothetical protein
MYVLWRVYKSGERRLVGYFESPADAGCAMDEDAHKEDDDAIYEMEREKDDGQGVAMQHDP